jgi:hypothetical protein
VEKYLRALCEGRVVAKLSVRWVRPEHYEEMLREARVYVELVNSQGHSIPKL